MSVFWKGVATLFRVKIKGQQEGQRLYYFISDQIDVIISWVQDELPYFNRVMMLWRQMLHSKWDF